MLSWPPAATMSASPSMMCWAPSATARRPEPQTWFSDHAALSIGRPALICACRAGFWPCAAVSTWPRMVSETSPFSIPARDTTSSSTAAPSACAGVEANAPLKEPTAVRAAEAITTLVIWDLPAGFRAGRPSLGRLTAVGAPAVRLSRNPRPVQTVPARPPPRRGEVSPRAGRCPEPPGPQRRRGEVIALQAVDAVVDQPVRIIAGLHAIRRP